MTTGDYTRGMQIGRITFDPAAKWPLHWREVPPEVFLKLPGYTVETPADIRDARPFHVRPKAREYGLCWLIEVKFEGDERASRYFTGECEPGWVGCTTTNPNLAQKYTSKHEAQIDILKLAPRLIGEWVAKEHGFS